jgi:co-chaperonin GroES (HSP10)
MKPVLHRLLVKVDPVEVKTQSGIVLALNERSEKKASVKGTVVSIGNTAYESYGSTPEREGIQPGTRIYYAKYAGAEVDAEHIFLNDEDVLGVVTDE